MNETRVTISVSRQLEATPARAFDAWLDPALARQFLFATPTGEMVRADIDPRVGGGFTLVDRRDGKEVLHTGRYVELDRPRRLAFSFAVPEFSAEETSVRVDFAPEGAGALATLTHTGVLPDYAAQTRQGWGMILNNLARVLG